MYVTRGKLINDKYERNHDIRFLRFLSRWNYRSSIREKNRRIAIWRIACALEEDGLTSRHCNWRERNWHSRLNGNRRWFVRQSSFSGLARRSFSRQLQGEKGRLLFTDLPARFYSRRMPSYTRSFLLHSHLSARSATTRHMDAHEERLLRRTRKRPRESSSRFASLVKWTRDFAYRTTSRLLRCLLPTLSLCPPRSFSLVILHVILLIFFHLLEDAHCSFETFLTSAFL